MPEIICQNCKKKKDHHAKNLCYYCYKKLMWKPKKKECKRCHREMVLHAKGLCDGCYNSVFHIEAVKDYNRRKYHNIDTETYKKVTKECVICGFDKIVELHHLDHNHKNNSKENLIGICPNHHKMIHNRLFRKEVFETLKEKGFKVPELYKDDQFFKQDITIKKKI